jgi:hypothetical protein
MRIMLTSALPLAVAALLAVGCGQREKTYRVSQVEHAFVAEGLPLGPAAHGLPSYGNLSGTMLGSARPFGVLVFRRTVDAKAALRSLRKSPGPLQERRGNTVVYSDTKLSEQTRRRIEDALSRLG